MDTAGPDLIVSAAAVTSNVLVGKSRGSVPNSIDEKSINTPELVKVSGNKIPEAVEEVRSAKVGSFTLLLIALKRKSINSVPIRQFSLQSYEKAKFVPCLDHIVGVPCASRKFRDRLRQKLKICIQ